MRIFLSKAVVLLTMIVGLSGCATPISPEKLANADYGAPPPKNYQQMVKNTFAHSLIDPTSPLYEFYVPSKGYTRNAPAIGTKEVFGWKVCGTVNSKNRMGGYAGSAPFFVLFRDGQIAYHLIGESVSKDFSFNNVAVYNLCGR